jgi:OOP family OmpA-OmpF porin
MKRRGWVVFFVLTVFGFMLGCAAQKAQAPKAMFQPQTFEAGAYVPKVNDFVVILDASTSMGDEYMGQPKLDIAKETVSRMNQTLPDLGYRGALRTFGQGDCLPGGTTSKIYGLTQYSESGLEGAIQKITCTGGNTPMESALDATAGDLKGVPGKIAVILLSDGIVLDNKPVVAAEALKSALGDRVCFYPVLVGNNPGGKALMDRIAKIGQCGFATTAEEIASSGNMANFVEKVFLAQAPPKPQPKAMAPPPPPPPAKPMDSDGDGVPDNLDKCPNTPKGVEVDAAGCWIVKDLKFDFNKAEIKPQYYPLLDKAVHVLEINPTLKIAIHGHTDSVGTEAYNQKLSERRAMAVKDYLVSKGIAADRLTAVGKGEADPIASNDTKEGRAQNRRVEFNVVSQ